MPKHPTTKSISLESLVVNYGATYTHEALAQFVIATNHPEWDAHCVEAAAHNIFLLFQALLMYHKVKFLGKHNGNLIIVDSIHAKPTRRNKHRNHVVKGQFDTGIVNIGGGEDVSVTGNY